MLKQLIFLFLFVSALAQSVVDTTYLSYLELVGDYKLQYHKLCRSNKDCKFVPDHHIWINNNLLLSMFKVKYDEGLKMLKDKFGYGRGYIIGIKVFEIDDNLIIKKVLLDTLLPYGYGEHKYAPSYMDCFLYENKLLLIGDDIITYDLETRKILRMYDLPVSYEYFTYTGATRTMNQVFDRNGNVYFLWYPIKGYKSLFRNKKKFDSYKPIVKVPLDSIFNPSSYSHFGNLSYKVKSPLYLSGYYSIYVDTSGEEDKILLTGLKGGSYVYDCEGNLLGKLSFTKYFTFCDRTNYYSLENEFLVYDKCKWKLIEKYEKAPGLRNYKFCGLYKDRHIYVAEDKENFCFIMIRYK